MAIFDLRTLYSGNLENSRKHVGEMNNISAKVTYEITSAFDAISKEDSQIVIRDQLTKLSAHEAQLANLSITLAGQADTIVTKKLDMILDALRKSIMRVERILTSVMNQDNNSR